MADPLSPSNAGAIIVERPVLRSKLENRDREKVDHYVFDTDFYMVQSENPGDEPFMVTGSLAQLYSNELDPNITAIEKLTSYEDFREPIVNTGTVWEPSNRVHFKSRGHF